ncbi:DMT family transporter [Persicobacter psychrovividus]|uniref:EamA domain-containing protein n=1 Tax=Persicobacter psychrovividus TaxID=387638 RepID=A0ABM7VES9_9BACT|nr:hypothetical protein PEPS_17170 [Persicobacter psychrovividus]
MDQSQSQKGILLACTTAFLWGFLSLAIKYATNFIPPTTIIWARFTIAFIAMFLYFLWKSPQTLKILIKPPFLLVVATVALSCNYLGYTMGIDLISPAGAQVIIQLGPMLLAVGGVVFFKEQLSRAQLMGFAIVTVGFFLFFRHQVNDLFAGQEDTFIYGALWVVFGAVTWATYALLQKKLVIDHPPQQLNLFLYGLPALLYIPSTSFTAIGQLDIMGWALLLFLGLNTLVAYGCLASALKYTEANKVSVIITLNPVITFICLAIMQAFQIEWITVPKMDIFTAFSGLIILFGVAIVVGSKKLKKKDLKDKEIKLSETHKE